jgi:hypothetical protein
MKTVSHVQLLAAAIAFVYELSLGSPRRTDTVAAWKKLEAAWRTWHKE